MYSSKLELNDITKYDVWSFGVTLFSSSQGQLPFEDITEVISGDFRIEGDDSYSTVLKNCICVDSAKRAIFKEVMSSMFFVDMFDFQQYKFVLYFFQEN